MSHQRWLVLLIGLAALVGLGSMFVEGTAGQVAAFACVVLILLAIGEVVSGR